MPRTRAISLLEGLGQNAELSEIYGVVIESIKKETLSQFLKSQNYTGNPAAGSVEFRRFVNSRSQPYGTARAAGRGDAVQAPPVTLNLDQHEEIVEEVAKFDLDTFGVGGVMVRRAADHIDTMASVLDIAFFDAADQAANAVVPQAQDAVGQLEELILSLETVQNQFVRGVPRNLISVVCNPTFYSSIRGALDMLPTSNVDTAAEEFGMFHGVRVYSGLNIPAGTDAIAMARGAVALPVVVYPYTEPEKIPLSNDFAVSLFYDYGVEVLTPDLVFKI